MRKNRIEVIPGTRYNRLLIIKEIENYIAYGKKIRAVECICDCGNVKVIQLQLILHGNAMSCGCLRMELARMRFKTHGMSYDILYTKWEGMIARCIKPKSISYKNYGGRGIKVCDSWLDFKNFKEDMEPTYKVGYELDRIDNDGPYSKKNCRWVTSKENKRNTRRNIKFNGECAKDASLRLGGEQTLVIGRLRLGWSTEDAFTMPLKAKKLSTDKT